METEVAGSGGEDRILEAMQIAEPAAASAGLSRLTEALHAHRIDGIPLSRMWTGFKRLLHRRGYFVGTPAQLAASLSEIEAVGEGFDLFDLARSLAEYDAARVECCGLTDRRALPQLQRFAKGCVCSRTPPKPAQP